MKISDTEYFLREKTKKNPIFLERFPEIDYKGLRILDMGCGVGALSVDLALKGAEEVIGVDLDDEWVNFANENLNKNYPELVNKVSFKCMDIANLENDYFDIIISKAAFEHIVNLDEVIIQMKKKIKIGGIILSGFGPLYKTAWGDHNRLKHKLPWAHLFFGEKYFISKLNKNRQIKINNINNLGLNGYSLKNYKEIFYNTEGLTVVDFRTNVSNKKLMKIIKLFSYFPFLEEYLTYNIYCVLRRY